MDFSFDVAHDTSTFNFHVNLKIDPATRTWACSAVCARSDVQIDIQNINIPDGTYLPIHSRFACIRDTVYDKVRNKIADVDFAGIMQRFLNKILNQIPTSVTVFDSVTFHFPPTDLAFADATGGLSVGFDGGVTFQAAPAANPVIVPLPVPDPAHSSIVRVAFYELHSLFAGLFGAGHFSRRIAGGNTNVYNTNWEHGGVPKFYNWAPGQNMVLYLSADHAPSIRNARNVWVLTEKALAVAGLTPQVDPDAYETLRVQAGYSAIVEDAATFDAKLREAMEPPLFAKYHEAITTASRATAFAVDASTTYRVCVINPSGQEVEAFALSRTSVCQSLPHNQKITISPLGQRRLTFAIIELKRDQHLLRCAVPGLSEIEAQWVLSPLESDLRHYVFEVGEAGVPLPTLQGIAVTIVAANYVPSQRVSPPFHDAYVEVVADLTVTGGM
jgi:hypothetical protein